MFVLKNPADFGRIPPISVLFAKFREFAKILFRNYPISDVSSAADLARGEKKVTYGFFDDFLLRKKSG